MVTRQEDLGGLLMHVEASHGSPDTRRAQLLEVQFLMEKMTTEIFRQDGKNFRSVKLDLNPDSSIRLGAQDIGASVEEFFGTDDYEHWVDLPVTAVAKLAYTLLREKYLGHSSAVSEFREFCTLQGVEHKWESWP